MTVLEDPIYWACIKCRREFTTEQTEVDPADGLRKHRMTMFPYPDELHRVEMREDH